MDAVPEPLEFTPKGLPTSVSVFSDAESGSRMHVLNVAPPDPHSHAPVVFTLHSIDVRTAPARAYWVNVQGTTLEAVACDETALQKQWAAREEERVREEQEALMALDESKDAGAVKQPDVTVVYMTGPAMDGRKVGVVTLYRPSFFVQVEKKDQKDRKDPELWFRTVLLQLAKSLQLKADAVTVQFSYRSWFNGFEPESPSNPCVRKKHCFARVAFPNVDVMRRAAYLLRTGLRVPGVLGGGVGSTTHKFRVAEDGIDVEQQFLDEFSLVPSGWHEIPGEAAFLRTDFVELLVDAEYEVRSGAVIRHRADMEVPPPLLIASLDAEMNPVVPDRFPRADRKSDAIVNLCVSFFWGGASPSPSPSPTHSPGPVFRENKEFERRGYVLAPHCAPISGMVVELYTEEDELLAAVRDELFVRKKVDIVTGYNHTKFDIKYMADRMRGVSPVADVRRFFRFGALIQEHVKLTKKNMTSSAMGSNELWMLNGVGFAYMDLLSLAKAHPAKLRTHSLKAVAAHFLRDELATNKYDMPYNLIPAAAAGSAADVRKLTAYCCQDTLVPIRLIEVWDAVKDLVQQSRIIKIPFATNVKVGQQQRVRNAIMWEAHRCGMVMNGVNERRDRTRVPSAEGGWVMESVAGLHDKPVAALDFASLYPSVQRNENLCWSTWVDPSVDTAAWEAAGLVINTYVTQTGTFRFVQNVEGVVRKVLNELGAVRSAAKRVMASEKKGSPGYQNADAKQKGTKIVMNSVYGVSNAQDGIMPCLALGTVTCFIGRQLNQRAEAFARERFGTVTLYGDTDSIFVHFPEPPEVLAGTRKGRLEYAMKMGFQAEEAINAMFEDRFGGSKFVKTENEKVYYPVLLCGKKTYAGLKFEPDDVAKVNDDLTVGGTIESKGIRNVRRDVPFFCGAMTTKLLDCLFYARDVDKFWDTVHSYTEQVALFELPSRDYTISQEIKGGYDKQVVVRPHIAVSYAREYAVPGSAYVPGDRVEYVMVEEFDPRRVVPPPTLVKTMAADRDAFIIEEENEEDEEEDAATGPTTHLPSTSSTSSLAMKARSLEELESEPEANTLDVEYYVDKGIVSVLKQLMPKEENAQKELLAFARRVKEYRVRTKARARGTGISKFITFDHTLSDECNSRDAILAAVKPRLSHCRPATPKPKSVIQSLMSVSVTASASDSTTVPLPTKRPKAPSKPKPKSGPDLKQNSLVGMFVPPSTSTPKVTPKRAFCPL